MRDLFLLCFEYLKTGLFAIGGGLATLPFLVQMSNNYPHWFTLEQLADMIAISESTPGAIGINMSTYVGYNTYGILGGILASISLTIPSIVIIIIIAKLMNKFNDNPYIQNSLKGLRPAVTGLIASAGFTVLKLCVYDNINNTIKILPSALIVIFFILTQAKPTKKIHPILFIIAGAICGIVFKL
ncbi:MAG: chromate transporter [Christensenellaceae bacterium]|nr:chromate transporter [Christensenellaceae bacterium]